MSVRLIREGVYCIDYYPLGRKGKRKQFYFCGTEDQANTYEKQLRMQHASLAQIKNPKIADVIPEFRRWQVVHRAPRTVEDYDKSYKFLLPHFGNYPVSRITEVILDQYKALRAAHPRATNKELDYLSGIISWMVKRKYANRLPFKIEHVPYVSPKPRIPHPSDIDKLLAQFDIPSDWKRYNQMRLKKAFVLLMWKAGTRFNDTAFIRWENIEWKSNIITLVKKGGEELVIVMPESVKSILADQIKRKGYVFENPATGRPYKSFKNLFKTACKKAGIKRMNPHLLRHAFATYVLEGTGDLRLVQELLGHKNIGTTQIYTDIATRRKREGLAKASAYIDSMKVSTTPVTIKASRMAKNKAKNKRSNDS